MLVLHEYILTSLYSAYLLLADKLKQPMNPMPSLQTDAFLGSNLWSMEEMKVLHCMIAVRRFRGL